MAGGDGVSTLLGDPKAAIRTMAVPILVSLAVSQLNTVADRAWCSGLGSDSLAAIALVNPIYMVLIGLGTGLGVGASAVVSRHIGAGDMPGAGSCGRHALIFSAVFPLVLTPLLLLSSEGILDLIGSGDINGLAYDYLFCLVLFSAVLIVNGTVAGMLRGEGAARASTAMVVMSAVLNMVLDPVMIYTLGMGISGASLATAVSMLASTLFGLSLYARGRTEVSLRRCGYSGSDLSEVLRMGVPQMLEYTVMHAMNVVLNYLILSSCGSDALTIISVAIMMVDIAIMPALAIGSALVPVASSAYGQGDGGRMRTAYSYSLRIGILAVLVPTALMFLLPKVMLLPFTYTEEMGMLAEEMAAALRVYSIYIPFFAMIPIGSSLLQALTVPNRSVVLAIIRNIVLILLYLVAAQHGLRWFYWADLAGEVFGGLSMMAVAWYSFARLMPGKGTHRRRPCDQE